MKPVMSAKWTLKWMKEPAREEPFPVRRKRRQKKASKEFVFAP